LGKRWGQGPVKIADIAKVQAIPPRFLEVILSQLKQAGFVKSQRGSCGGYILLRRPSELSVGEIIRFLQGPIGPVDCVAGIGQKCPIRGDCVFLPMWKKAQQAMTQVYDNTSIQDLLDEERSATGWRADCYVI